MTTENVNTKIQKDFTLSSYEGGNHRVKGYIDKGILSFKESLSPLERMIQAFTLRPLGTKIRVTMEEID
uniref:Uncharacterized protein n=1 Tax=viral metagenome TaxID=1070528 RepID=A0A6M3KPI0_9ZZZZ